MEYKKVIFETREDAYWFLQFLNLKAVRYANDSNELSVTIRDFITDQQMYQLMIAFGRWYNK